MQEESKEAASKPLPFIIHQFNNNNITNQTRYNNQSYLGVINKIILSSSIASTTEPIESMLSKSLSATLLLANIDATLQIIKSLDDHNSLIIFQSSNIAFSEKPIEPLLLGTLKYFIFLI
jgi:hypothetical protein